MTKIPLTEAEFFFRAEPGQLPAEFVAANRSARLADMKAGKANTAQRYPQSCGAHVSGWLQEPRATPAGVFALTFLSRLPPETHSSILNGLHEIGSIEGQQWALEMAATIEEWIALRRPRQGG